VQVTATKKKRAAPRSARPATKRDLVENNPGIADAVTNRLGPYYRLAVAITAIGALLWGGAQLYTMMGGRWMVSDHTLDLAITGVKTEVNAKIVDTKDEVVKNQNTIKTEITGSINDVVKSLNNVAKNQTAAAMDQADVQVRLGFTQKQALQGQLSVVNQALVKDPNDQIALTRKMQLEDFIKQNDQYMQDAQTKMTRLRNQ
jgi:hypothetical protein